MNAMVRIARGRAAAVRRSATSAAIVLLAASSAVAQPSAYDGIRRELQASGVPVLLPQPIPAALGTFRSISVIDVGAQGYYIGFSSLADCSGALSCASFHVAGWPSAERTVRVAGRTRRLRLFDGTPAAYVPRDCSGESCTEASLRFTRGTAVYELDAKTDGNDLAALEGAYRRLRVVR